MKCVAQKRLSYHYYHRHHHRCYQLFKKKIVSLSSLVIRCPSLPIPANGVKTGCRDPLSERYGTICSFSCNIGYNLTGSSRRQCLENKTWSGITFSCQGEQTVHRMPFFVQIEGIKDHPGTID